MEPLIPAAPAPRARAPLPPRAPRAAGRARVHVPAALRLHDPAHVNPQRRRNILLQGIDQANVLLDNAVYFGRLRPRDRN